MYVYTRLEFYVPSLEFQNALKSILESSRLKKNHSNYLFQSGQQKKTNLLGV